jgi:hypothetical protein
METRREEIDPFEGIDDPTLWVQIQHEMRTDAVSGSTVDPDTPNVLQEMMKL